MRPKKNKNEAKEQQKPRVSAKPAEAEPEPEIQETAQSMDRISLNFFVTEDGKVDVSRMRESMKTRIKETLPQLISEFAPKEQAEQMIQAIPASWVDTLYDGIGSLEAVIFSKVLGIDPAVCQQVFTFNALEKEKLIPPTQNVLNKRMPDWLLKYKDEVALVMMLTMMTIAKIQIAKQFATISQAIPSKDSSAPVATEHGPNGKETTKPTDEAQRDGAAEESLSNA